MIPGQGLKALVGMQGHPEGGPWARGEETSCSGAERLSFLRGRLGGGSQGVPRMHCLNSWGDGGLSDGEWPQVPSWAAPLW